MAEIWDILATSKRQQHSCRRDVKLLKEYCERDHKKKHVIECDECYGQIQDRMQRRYTASSDEWFTGQTELLEDLVRLFSDTKRHLSGLEIIENRINETKHEWIRRTLGSSHTTRRVIKELIGQTQFLRLDDRSLGLAAVLDDIRTVLGQGLAAGLAAPQSPDDALDRLMSQVQAADDGTRAGQGIFFPSFDGGSQATASTLGLDKFKGGTPLDLVMEEIMDKHAASKSLGDLRDKHRRRLDEIRRARAAHELQKTKKTKNKQAAAEKRRGLPEDPHEPNKLNTLNNAGPCATCSTVPDTTVGFVSCALCQVLAGSDLDGHDHPVVYCSSDCYHHGYERHLREAHTCGSGDQCVRLKDEDVEMEGNDRSLASVLLCTECLGTLKIATAYCCTVCAGLNFQRHREEVHLPARQMLLKEVDDLDKLAHAFDDETKYRAKNIGHHLTPLSQALEEIEQKSSITVKILE